MADAAGEHSQSRPALVEFVDVQKWFPGTAVSAVSDVNLQVAEGEFLAILGPSGSGKTTLLRMIAGFVDPSEGDIRIGGRPVTGLAPEERGLGVVFQNYALFPHLNVTANVAFPLQLRKLGRAETEVRVREVLQMVGLEGLDLRFPHELSGGQQQRVALARALVFQPRLLLMDEPLGALDKNMRQQMQLELRRLHRKLGVTIVYITHDQEEALAMADRVAIMRDGKIVQVSPPNELYRQPRDRFVAGFLGHCNFLSFETIGREEGLWRVAVGGFCGEVAGPEVSAEQGAAKLAVRPQYIEFADEGVDATVLDSMFMGEMVDLQLSLDMGETVLVKQLAHVSQTPAVGARVKLRWDWTKARIVQ